MTTSISKNKQKKFNIFLGEFLNKVTNTPSIHNISKELFARKKKDYILINNNLSLPELAQNLLDDVILEKNEILNALNKLYSKNSKFDNNFYRDLLDSNMFSTIISSNYDFILEDYFLDLLNKQTPFIQNEEITDKVTFYKIYGDLDKTDKFILSTQDIKRLKILGFYDNFWKKLRSDLSKNPTILLGINFDDSTIIGILDFIFSKIKKSHQPIYLYTENSINSEVMKKFIDSYSVNLIEGNLTDFLSTVKNYFPDLKNEEGDAPQMEYA